MKLFNRRISRVRFGILNVGRGVVYGSYIDFRDKRDCWFRGQTSTENAKDMSKICLRYFDNKFKI